MPLASKRLKKLSFYKVFGALGFKNLSFYKVFGALGFKKLSFYKVFGGLGFKKLSLRPQTPFSAPFGIKSIDI